MAITINCPQCQDQVIWDNSSLYRPFCSNRCKMLDLGAWATQEHVIAGEGETEELLALSESEHSGY